MLSEMEAKRISVIMPTYNPGEYLTDAVESVLSQGLPGDMELIVVDDGSEERAVLDRVRAKWGGEQGVRFVTVDHGGQSHARNEGLKHCRGEYVCFCDDDDAYHPRALRKLLDIAVETGAEVVQGGVSKRKTALSLKGKVRIMTGRQALKRCLHQTDRVSASPWSKLIRKDLLESSEGFPEGKLYEDLALIPRLMGRSSKVAVCKATLYYYRQREGSSLHVFSSRRFDVLDITAGFEREFEGDADVLPAARDRCFSAACNILLLYLRNNRGMDYATLKSDAVVQRCLKIINSRRRGVLLGSGVRAKNRMGAAASYLGFPLFYAISRL